MHEYALALDACGNIRMREERFNDPASRRSVLRELRTVQIKADDNATLRRVDQRLGDPRVRQDVSRDVDGQSGAADFPSVDALEVFSRRVVDLGLALARPGPLVGPSRP